MVKIVKGALLTAAVSLVLGGVASAQPVLTDAEFKCQTSTSKAGSKFVGAKAKCAIKCQQNASKTVPLNPRSDCYAPYAGTTLTCVTNVPLRKGAEEKFEDAIRKACDPTFKPGTDCPECYSGGDCTLEAGDRVQNIESQVDDFGPGVFCKGQGLAPTAPTKEELGCEVNTAKTLAKLVGSLNKCYDKCNGAIRKGLSPAGSCNPPSPTNVAAQDCINKASTKAVAGVDKKCSVIGGIAVPDCDESTPGTPDEYPPGSAWVVLVTSAVTGNVPGTYCSSPSGAFIE